MDRALWECMLTAELNEQYYRHLADRSRIIDMTLRVIAALGSSAATVAFLTTVSTWAVPALATIAAVASVIGLVIGAGALAREREALAAQWTEVAGDAHELWNSRPSSGDDVHGITRRSEQLQKKDTRTRKTKLVDKLQDEIDRQHGAEPARLPA